MLCIYYKCYTPEWRSGELNKWPYIKKCDSICLPSPCPWRGTPPLLRPPAAEPTAGWPDRCHCSPASDQPDGPNIFLLLLATCELWIFSLSDGILKIIRHNFTSVSSLSYEYIYLFVCKWDKFWKWFSNTETQHWYEHSAMGERIESSLLFADALPWEEEEDDDDVVWNARGLFANRTPASYCTMV